MKLILLNRLRNQNLARSDFREITSALSKLIASEIALKTASKEVILAPILRAGLAMLPAFQEKFKSAPIGLIGIKRDEHTATPHLYYENIPLIHPKATILILDPMLATGGSACLALNLLKSRGAGRCMLISMISAPEGAACVQKTHPDAFLYTVALDMGLDARKYIVPGLGDFGDRYFGTI